MSSGPEALEPPADGWAAHDLRVTVDAGLARGHPLLTAGETLVARRILALVGAAATVYARLVGRRPLAFPVDTLSVPESLPAGAIEEAIVELVQVGLVDRMVPWSWRAELSARARLAKGCLRLGLRRSGRRGELEARLLPHTGWDDTPWVRPRHRSLVRRLQRFATLRAWPREHDLVLERLGAVAYVDHPITTGPSLFRDRRALLAWEQVLAALAAGDLAIDAALFALDHPQPPALLDLRGALRHALLDEAQRRERTVPAEALPLYDALARDGGGAQVHFRRSRCLEALGRPEEALDALLEARTLVSPVGRRTLARAGRRIARSLRRGFPPEPPLSKPRVRTLRLERTGTDARPRWTDERLTVEEAVLGWLADHGRDGIHAEGRLWRSLFALVFADAYFLPITGTLPVPRLAGPLDLGTPAFRRRRPLVDKRLGEVAVGQAPALVADAIVRFGDRRLAGRHPDVPHEWLVRVAEQVPGAALAKLLEALLEGRSRGLPDLFVAGGEPTQLPSYPRRLAGTPLLVEIKGPGDTLSDAQRVWLDRLARWGLDVELWDVREAE